MGMKTEIEATFTNIDVPAMREKLREVGATLLQEERLMRRKNFDYPDERLREVAGWVRLRDEGDKVTLSYKQLNDRSLHGTKEVSIVVDNFEETEVFLISIGLVSNSYHETKRESWALAGVEIEIDTWPWIPTFLEIEGGDEDSVKETAKILGFDWNSAKHGSVENVYQEAYDVTEDEIDDWDTIVFSPVPENLEKKRRA